MAPSKDVYVVASDGSWTLALDSLSPQGFQLRLSLYPWQRHTPDLQQGPLFSLLTRALSPLRMVDSEDSQSTDNCPPLYD